MHRVVVGVSGASGIVLAFKMVKALTYLGHYVDLVFTRDAFYTAVEEMGADYCTIDKFLSHYTQEERSLISTHKINDFTAPIASGSFQCYGMIIIPCSMATVAAVATGLSDNLLRRAADVTLKERRHLVIVPREAPFSEIHLENMLKISRMGGVIVPPCPAWYMHPKSLDDVENFIVGRSLDALKIDNKLYKRWREEESLVANTKVCTDEW
jgi:4-hydroxy-3-polyprenylbenzoate decarboxylase